MLREDLYRLGGKTNMTALIKALLFNRAFRPICTLRLCQTTAHWPKAIRVPGQIAGRLLHRYACSLAGMDLPWETQIAAGFAITHGWGLVVAPGSRIGRNVTLFHGVTIGRHDRSSDAGVWSPGFPTIEDEVWIGPQAIVVGDVIIGKGSRIAGGAFVTESVPAQSLVIGNPGKIVKSNCRPDVPNRCPG